jgi:hypothetical protein
MLAANILETLRQSDLLARRVELTSREHAALRRVLANA